jgi:predicted nucleic acid-binding protein
VAGNDRISLDTNILVYAVDADAGERHERASALLKRCALGDSVLTLQSLVEFFHATTRKRLLDPARAREFVRQWLEIFDVTQADEEALRDAMDAVTDHSLSFYDALLLATARLAGCTALLTEDMQHGRRIGGVEIVNPFIPDGAARAEELLRSEP